MGAAGPATASVLLMTSKAILLLVMLLAPSCSLVHAEHLDVDVIIIGAGMCGIMAGSVLTEKGITNFLILEARDVIGGRVRREEFAGAVIEMGANWVEGISNGDTVNPIWTFAQQVNLRTFLSDFGNESANTYDKNGYIPVEIVQPIQDFIDSQSEYITDLSLSLRKNKEPDISVLTAQRLYGRVASTPLEMCVEYQTFDFEYAEPPRVNSLKNSWPNPTFADFGDDEQFVADPRGYVAIFEVLAKYLEPKNGTGEYTDPRLKLHKVVNRIEYSKSGVKVYTEDGSSYSAKLAVLTVSIGVLQSSLIQYVPDLPFWKLEALYAYDMAIYTKIFLKFPERFWPTGPGTQFFNYADDTRGYYPSWQHLDREFPDRHMIFVTVTDTESRRIEQQPDNQTQAEMMAVLRSMFGPDIPEPEAIFVPRWWSDRYFRGSYSNWPIGIDSPVFSDIRAPVDTLYFAGEATSDSYNGYVHGAYYEGIKVGKKVAACLQKNICPSGSTKKRKTRPPEKNLLETTCAGPIKEELDTQRRHWLKKFDALQNNISSADLSADNVP